MKPHIRIYYQHKGLAQDDWIGCAICNATAVDIHHIDGRGAGSRKRGTRRIYDDPSNLVALCRRCHEDAHGGKISKELLKQRA
jgi:hypothetical protein